MQFNLCCFFIQEAAEGLKGPKVVVFKEKDFSSAVNHGSNKNPDFDQLGDPQDTSKLLEANG